MVEKRKIVIRRNKNMFILLLVIVSLIGFKAVWVSVG